MFMEKGEVVIKDTYEEICEKRPDIFREAFEQIDEAEKELFQ